MSQASTAPRSSIPRRRSATSCASNPAADARISRPVAQQRGRHRRYVDAVHLQGKHGGAVADMAEGDLRLNGDNAHAVTVFWAGSVIPSIALVPAARFSPAAVGSFQPLGIVNIAVALRGHSEW